MTKFLEDALGLPHLDEMMTNDEENAEEITPETKAIALRNDLPYSAELVEGADHARKMDMLFDETIRHAQSIMDLGFNMDPARAPRMFEVAASVYKVALDAANAKREAQLKAIKLMQNQMKIDMARTTTPSAPSDEVIDASAVIVENRNELLKRLKSDD